MSMVTSRLYGRPATMYDRAYNFVRDSRFFRDLLGYSQSENTKASAQAQIGYEEYLRRGNERAQRDWYKNLPGRTIRYPEFSYAGQIRRSDTAIARLGYESDSAYANYYGNLPYRTAGLYGISSRVSRSL